MSNLSQEKPIKPDRRRIFVTGGTGFLGYRVVRALLDEGADVTVLIRPDGEDKLGLLKHRVHQVQGDPWNPASMRGLSRNHDLVIHLVGGIKQDPSRGLTFRHLNFVSARNVAAMAVNDGVPHLVLLSAAVNPIGVSSEYLESKREAERYLQRSGLFWSIVRAPALYAPGQGHANPFLFILRLLSRIPVIGWPLVPYAPMRVDTAARGIAQLALTLTDTENRIIAPGLLRRMGRTLERKFLPAPDFSVPDSGESDLDEPPFGWLPSNPVTDKRPDRSLFR